MSDIDTVQITGTLVRGPAGFVLEADDGRRIRLELERAPVDHVQKRVVVGGVLAEGTLVVDGVASA